MMSMYTSKVYLGIATFSFVLWKSFDLAKILFLDYQSYFPLTPDYTIFERDIAYRCCTFVANLEPHYISYRNWIREGEY